MTDVTVIRASQSAGLLLLSLTNALHRFESNTASLDVYREELGMPRLSTEPSVPLTSLKEKADVLKVAAKFDLRAQNKATAVEAVNLFSSLMGAVGELVVCF